MRNNLLTGASLLILLLSLMMLSSCGIILPNRSDRMTSQTEAVEGEEDSTKKPTNPDPEAPETEHTHVYSSWGQGQDSHYKLCTCGAKAGEEAHTPVSCGVSAPTFLTPGRSSGTECAVCRYRLSGEETLPAFSETCSDLGYRALATYENGESLQAFYEAFYEACVLFHTSETLNAELNEDDYIAFQLSYGDYRLSKADADLVWTTIRTDCPIFYWINNNYKYTDTTLYVVTNEAYASGAVRSAINETIYEDIQATAKQEHPYVTVLELHDKILDRLSYAYENDGVTPKNTVWAHNIIGYFEYNSGVCECYTETFSLFLNYFGIENYAVSGTAGGPHAWNLVKMDDGRYYWFDLTWDDQPAESGRCYDYFCKTDAGFLLSERSIDTTYFNYPKRSETEYEAPIASVGSKFTIDGFEYQVIGSAEVELFSCNKTGHVTVPETILWEGMTYTVTSIGKLENNTLHNVFGPSTRSVTLPKSVKTIRGNALHTTSIQTVTIAEDNPYLIFDDGAIYTKNSHVLLAYLPSAEKTVLTLRDDTEAIASFAVLRNSYLTTLEIGIGVKKIDRYAISECTKLTTILYGGTREEWNQIIFGDTGIPTAVTVICRDEVGGE